MEIIKKEKPSKKVPGTSSTREIFQTICKLFQSIKKKEKPSQLFYEVSINKTTDLTGRKEATNPTFTSELMQKS